MKRDVSVSLFDANLYGLLTPLPSIVPFVIIYILRWGLVSFTFDLLNFFASPFLLIAVLIVGIILHEAIHGITWMLVGRKPLSAIKFGVYWWALTPYAHCTEPMEVNAYRIGVAMPGVVLGIAPCIGGIIFGNGWWFIFGLLFTYVACGDALILWLLRKVKAGRLVEDHPSRAGCYVIE